MNFDEFISYAKEVGKHEGSRKPARDTPINEDDVANLKIAMATSKSLNEFLSKV